MYDIFPNWLLALIVIVSIAFAVLQIVMIIKFFQIANDLRELLFLKKSTFPKATAEQIIASAYAPKEEEETQMVPTTSKGAMIFGLIVVGAIVIGMVFLAFWN